MVETLAWPFAVVLIATIAILVFRIPFSEFLRRSESIKFPGGELTRTTEQPEVQVASVSQAEELLKAFDNVLLREQEENIRRDLKEKGLTENTDTTRVLIKHLAATQISLVFEKIDRSIFGSQVTLLHLLNAQREGLPRGTATGVYKEAAASSPDAYRRIKFEEWLEFLQICLFVLVTDDRKLAITIRGVEFLSFLTREGKLGNHPL